MKAVIRLLVALLACQGLRCAAANAEVPPVKLAPYKVEERPFGFLGIRHATIAMNPWKLVLGLNALRFLQIDELDPLSPGVAAGILPGDHVIGIDGVPIAKIGVGKLRRMGSEMEVGQKISLEIFRPSDGSRRTLEVVVPKKPKPNQPPPASTLGPGASSAAQPLVPSPLAANRKPPAGFL